MVSDRGRGIMRRNNQTQYGSPARILDGHAAPKAMWPMGGELQFNQMKAGFSGAVMVMWLCRRKSLFLRDANWRI